MDYPQWEVRNHVISASYVRGYRRGVRDERNARLRLSVNEYVPKSNSPHREDEVTVVFVHGVGSSKESYEPFFQQLKNAGLAIHSIWALDIAWHGKSFELNRSIIGDEPHWDDVARDIVHMINVFQERIQPPIICIGQSWGGYPAVSAALLHPRLFAAVVALEPLLITASLSPDQPGFPWTTAKLMARRRDTWKSKEEARTRLLAGAYFQAFDKDVFDKVMETDLKRTGNGEEVTLVTPKAQEVLTMMRLEESEKRRAWTDMTGRLDQLIGPGFYRAEPAEVAKRLGAVRPAVLYVFATQSKVGHDGYWEWLKERTGSGEMGSGGAERGMVDLIWIQDSGHPMPLEKPKETAAGMVPWIQTQIKRWNKEASMEKGEFYVDKLNPVWLKKLEKL